MSLAETTLNRLLMMGVREFCISPGARNAPLVYLLASRSDLTVYQWPEERSSAFFALGRIKSTCIPVAVVTTSGTAVAELLPAVIEAHYTGLPLILLTADRPRRYRGTGAPQSIEQKEIFTSYVSLAVDLEEGEVCHLEQWDRSSPLHINLCFEEHRDAECSSLTLRGVCGTFCSGTVVGVDFSEYVQFLKQVRFPLVIVGELPDGARPFVLHMLLELGFPVYLEPLSGLRETSALEPFRIDWDERIFETAAACGYPIDGILRLGGVPVMRFWRDLEDSLDHVRVLSLSHLAFSGMSGGACIVCDWKEAMQITRTAARCVRSDFKLWQQDGRTRADRFAQALSEEPRSEQGCMKLLSARLAHQSLVYLGNSLPIRLWDQCAMRDCRGYVMHANRGANGIDGQVATFLGCSEVGRENWAFVGDLTLLYDLIAPWITAQLPVRAWNLVVINNGGGAIFRSMFKSSVFQNAHALSFELLAGFWGLDYLLWNQVPTAISRSERPRLVELRPDAEATGRVWSARKLIAED